MRQMTIAGALCIAAVLSVADRAEGDMVGVSWSATNSPVVRLDESTGAGATIGLSGFTGLNALAVDGSGTLYSAVDNINAITKPLITINPSTGAGTAVAPLNFGAIEPFVRGLAFSPAGVLYAVNNTGPPGQTVSHDLYTIDPNTGIGTHVGITGLGVQGIDFSPGGILYGWDVFDGLVTIDTATGAATDVNPLVGGSALLIQRSAAVRASHIANAHGNHPFAGAAVRLLSSGTFMKRRSTARWNARPTGTDIATLSGTVTAATNQSAVVPTREST